MPARLNGFYNRFGLSFLIKRFFRDRDAARASLQRVLTWDVDRIAPAHGTVIATDARRHLEAALTWLG